MKQYADKYTYGPGIEEPVSIVPQPPAARCEIGMGAMAPADLHPVSEHPAFASHLEAICKEDADADQFENDQRAYEIERAIIESERRRLLLDFAATLAELNRACGSADPSSLLQAMDRNALTFAKAMNLERAFDKDLCLLGFSRTRAQSLILSIA